MQRDAFTNHLRLKKPCGNCPFRLKGAIELEPGRLDGIVESLLADDRSTFQCHKTVHSDSGGEWDDDDGTYTPSGNEAMCAGAAALLMKRGRPTVVMRVAIALRLVRRDQWDAVADQVIS